MPFFFSGIESRSLRNANTPVASSATRSRGYLRVRNVLLPPDVRSNSSPNPSSQAPPAGLGGVQSIWDSVSGGTAAFANQLMSHFFIPAVVPSASEKVLEAAATKAAREATDAENANKILADLSPYLSVAGVNELRHIRKLSSLAALTYKPHLVTAEGLRRLHNLQFVTASWLYDPKPYERSKTAEEYGDEGDGMTVSLGHANEMYTASAANEPSLLAALAPGNLLSQDDKPARQQQHKGSGKAQEGAPLPLIPLVPPFPLAPVAAPSSSSSSNNAAGGMPQLVAAKLAEAAAAASAASVSDVFASVAAQAAGSFYAGLASLPLASALVSPPKSPTQQQQGANASGSTNAPAKLFAVGAPAPASSVSSITGPASLLATAAAVTASGPPAPDAVCPSTWYVADEPRTNTRFVVIQGSDTLDHWKLNLTFDPVTFEDPMLGVKVHRGVYEAALVLYDRLLPLVCEHVESSPFAKITFTGHSIGGSMATLLMLMFKARGVIPESSMVNTFTFGAPSVFLEPGMCGCMHSPPAAAAKAAGEDARPKPPTIFAEQQKVQELLSKAVPYVPPSSASSVPGLRPKACGCGYQPRGPGGLLHALGLHDHHVSNVMMARDIVPRAFTCDYSPIAEVLRGWGPGFRDHCCLSRDGRRHLYYFVGQLMVMQPDPELTFVADEPLHPLLPQEAGVYAIGTPLASKVRPAPYLPSMAAAPANLSMSFDEGGPSLSSTSSTSSYSSMSSVDGEALTSYDLAAAAAGAPIAPRPPAGSSSSAPSGSSTAHHRRHRHRQHRHARQPLGVFVPATLMEAIFELMDTPHPLDVLLDPGAYLEKGSISRYHNPDNYTLAIGRAIHHTRRRQQQQEQVRLLTNAFLAAAHDAQRFVAPLLASPQLQQQQQQREQQRQQEGDCDVADCAMQGFAWEDGLPLMPLMEEAAVDTADAWGI